MIELAWIEEAVSATLPTKQVYGFCFNENGRILLIEHGGHYNLPGGKPEGEETAEETLRRECMEEAQIELGEIEILGYQFVANDQTTLNGAPFAQLRTAARLIKVLPSAQDPDSGRTFRRHLCPASSVPRLLNWGASGEAQVAAACRAAEQMWNLKVSPYTEIEEI